MKSEVRKFCGTKLICSLCVTFTENEMGNWKSFISLGEYPRSLLVILVSFSFNYGNNSTGNSTQKEGSQSNQIMTHISKNQIYYFPALNFSFTLFAVSPHSRLIPSPQPFTQPYFIANYLRKYRIPLPAATTANKINPNPQQCGCWSFQNKDQHRWLPSHDGKSCHRHENLKFFNITYLFHW
jgi:hypothetical protein